MPAHKATYTPHKSRIAGYQTYRQKIPDLIPLRVEYGIDMDGHWLGPCRISEFLEALMPISTKDLRKTPKRAKFVRAPLSWLEKHICEAFNKQVKKYKLSPNFPFFVSADSTEKGVDVLYRPDGGFKEYQRAGSANDDTEFFDWCNSGLLVEFKRRTEMDPFRTLEEIEKAAEQREGEDKKKPVAFEKCIDDATKVRGQLAMYAMEVFAHQHRLHLFQLLICGSIARFLFWDHSGAIVSDRFDYIENPGLLVEFLWRYNHMSAAARGLDSTASRANPEEARMFKAAVEEFLANMENANHPQRELPNAAETLSPQYPVHKITVNDDTSKESMDILIQRPFFRSHSPIGRGTRAYLAYAIKEHELVFFKDTWRVVHKRLVPERQICSDLEAAEIPFVPSVLCGGDVTSNGDYGKTQCLTWAKKLKDLAVGFNELREFQHHRLVQQLAYPVECAPWSQEFIAAFRDCLEAMDLAMKQCGLVHRDISLGNVMLNASTVAKGVLADWDHSGKAKLSEGQVHQRFRTGTWQFMSIAMLADPLKAHEALDDLESVFWALLYGAMHRFDHTNNATILIKMFDEKDPTALPDGSIAYIGGSGKRAALGKLHTGLRFTSLPLQTLICRLANEWDDYYIAQTAASRADNSTTTVVGTSNVQGPAITRPESVPAMPSRRTHKVKDHREPADLSAVARKNYEALRTKLSDAQYWLDIFDDALEQEGWTKDVIPDPYPRGSSKAETRAHQKAAHSTFLSGQEIASRDENDAASQASQVEEAEQHPHPEGEYRSNERHTAESGLTEPDDMQMDGTGHHELTMSQQFPPVVPLDDDDVHSQHSGPSSPASATAGIPGIPPPPPIAFPRVPLLPPASSSLLSGRSVRSKRSIDDIEDDNDDANFPAVCQPSTLAPRPTKKPRSISISANAEAGPSNPKSSKSKKAAAKAAVDKTRTIKEDSRPGKAAKKKNVRSGDLVGGAVVSTRRQGLRSAAAAQRSASR
ncbi:hypothetical protein BC835DRAFT_1410786 [Cytidiella melzeri]|nr:hypothetical protein BC835DRAFT_1410786 [Cytidiella melzeri]